MRRLGSPGVRLVLVILYKDTRKADPFLLTEHRESLYA